MEILTWSALSLAEQQTTLSRPALADNTSLQIQVADIISAVKNQGDAALHAFSQRFDGVDLTSVAVPQASIDRACQAISPELKEAIALAKANIEAFHIAQKTPDITVTTSPGVQCQLRTQALQSVGLYAPGGSAPLPSTILMTAVPAKIAGCPQIVLCSPPPISDVMLYTAKLCGVDKIYQVGGAQAVAAMAFGTNTVAKVDKIFGPGNRFVTEAKKQVSSAIGGAGIDMPAGPSEVLVIADESADPSFVAADLLSQAEHGEDSQSVLLTTCPSLASAVNQQLTLQLAQLSRAAIAQAALKNSPIIVCDDMEQAIELSNCYAPEHLIIQTRQPHQVLDNIYAAGSVFLGPWSPESAGDYASGTNHVLPTYGMCRSYSSLSLADFSRRFTVQELTRQGLANLQQTIVTLANAEGLDAHANAVTIRLANQESIND